MEMQWLPKMRLKTNSYITAIRPTVYKLETQFDISKKQIVTAKSRLRSIATFNLLTSLRPLQTDRRRRLANMDRTYINEFLPLYDANLGVFNSLVHSVSIK